MAIERGVFLVPWGGIDIQQTVDRLGESNADFVSFSVKDSMGRTWAKSEIVPQWAGGRDPLGEACGLLRRIGVKVRASVAVFADAYHGQLHPDWLAVGSDGVPASRPGWTEDWYYHLCPTREPQREYTVRFIEELVSRYQLDGIDLDFIRFPWKGANMDGPEREFCFCRVCRTKFKEATGQEPADELDRDSRKAWYDWRSEVISSMVEAVREITQPKGLALAPFIALWTSDGFGVGELEKARRRFGQNHGDLARLCTQVSPMLYHRFTDEPTCYTLRTVRWVRDITWHLRDLGASVCAVVQGGPPASPMEVIDEVRGAFDAGAAAVMSYPGWSWSVDNAYWSALARSYKDIASVPQV